jgi:hypothetical protein
MFFFMRVVLFTILFLVLQALTPFFIGEILSNRLINVRYFSENHRYLALDIFFKISNNKNYDIILSGDSQPYGDGRAFYDSLSHYLGLLVQPKKVLNISIVDGRLDDTTLVLLRAADSGVRTNLLFIDLNPSHTKLGDTTRRLHPGLYFPSPSFSMESTKALLFDIFTIPTEGAQASPKPGQLGEIVGSEAYYESLHRTVAAAKKVATHVVVYASVFSPSTLEASGYHLSDLQPFNERLKVECQKQNIICAVPQALFNSSDFMDIIHFNRVGSKKMAQYVNDMHVFVNDKKGSDEFRGTLLTGTEIN